MSEQTMSTSKAAEEYLTAEQIAARLQVAPSTVYDWTRRRASQNPIPVKRISRKILRFRWSEVTEWLERK